MGLAARRACLPGVHPHTLRHSSGYYLANKGHDLRLIQDYLGHRDPKSPFWKSWCGQSLAVWVDGAVGHEADHGQGDHSLGHLWQVLVVPGQPAPAPEPAECALNGLIANDKFCLTRAVRLRLSWRRARCRLRPDRPQPPW